MINSSISFLLNSTKVNKITKGRLAGIDLLKSIAIFAVVILHTDEGIVFDSSYWNLILRFCRFAVPFFLATSFYIAVKKIHNVSTKYPFQARLYRLVVPYGIWSLFYIAYRIVKYLLSGEHERINDLVKDPLGLILMGDAAIHLYFIPLLIVGTILLKLFENLIRRQLALSVLIGSLIGSLIFSEVLLVSGNAYQIRGQIALSALAKSINIELNQLIFLRIIAVLLVWMSMCLPYLLMAIIINKYKFDQSLTRYGASSIFIWLVIFIIIIFSSRVNYDSVESLGDAYAVIKGYTALLLGISLSNLISEKKFIKLLGGCSFGIYLVHMIFIEAFMSLEKILYPETLFRDSTLNLLLFAIVSFLASLLISYLLLRRKTIARFVFGI